MNSRGAWFARRRYRSIFATVHRPSSRSILADSPQHFCCLGTARMLHRVGLFNECVKKGLLVGTEEVWREYLASL